MEILNDPHKSKLNAFTRKERDKLHLNGLLPYGVETIQTQVSRFTLQFSKLTTDIERYLYLNNLYDTDTVLFYYIVHSNPLKYLPIVYDPTIADACLQYCHNYSKPQGLYLCIKNKGYSYLGS
jgi:malate dehydrogenase (oxaloacetate-decarboxylating)(NADP+)